MFHQLWSRVVRGNYLSSRAILKGYDRKGVRDEVFPVIVPASIHSQVHGLVYFDVSTDDLFLLDEFEGDYYFRKSEQVLSEKAGIIQAEVYVLKEKYNTIISQQDWDAGDFEKFSLQCFINKQIADT